MKLLCDEGVERQVVEELRAAGLAVRYVAELEPGLADEDVLSAARHEGEILVTNDKDFGELTFRRGQASAGIILVRLAGLSPEEKARVVRATVTGHARELQESFTVVERERVRIRRFRPN